MITYTILYINNEEKLFLSEPNPSFNKDLKETATRKHIYNLPASQMMTRLITARSVPMSKISSSQLDTALYFGPFTNSSNVLGKISQRSSSMTSLQDTYIEKEEDPDKDNLCVARIFSRNSRTMSDKVVYNSNIDYDLPELIQEFSTTSDVYFGWTNYYMCSFIDLKSYIQNKESRKTPVVPSFKDLSESDQYLRDKIAIYEMAKAYSEWFWWLPLWKEYREELVRSAKQVVDAYYEKKKTEAEQVSNDAVLYERDLDNLLLNIEIQIKYFLPESAKNVSILIKTR